MMDSLELIFMADRVLPRLVKLCLLLGAISLIVEGVLELKKLKDPFTRPPSVPGESKILEHFALQHLLWPVVALSLVFYPALLKDVLASTIGSVFFAFTFVLLIFPELIVSVKGDLFRPCPFDLKVKFFKRIEMIKVGFWQINVLQLTHLGFSHLLLAICFIWIVLEPSALHFFAGPLTSSGF
jgi:hypothetical protein